MRKELKAQIIEKVAAQLAENPNFYLADIAGLNAGQLDTFQSRTLFHRVGKGFYHTRRLQRGIMAALLSSDPFPCRFVDRRQVTNRQALFDKMLRHIKAIFGKSGIVLFFDIDMKRPVFIRMRQVIYCQSLNGRVDEKNHLVRTVFDRLTHHINGVCVFREIIYAGRCFKTFSPPQRIRILSPAGFA